MRLRYARAPPPSSAVETHSRYPASYLAAQGVGFGFLGSVTSS